MSCINKARSRPRRDPAGGQHFFLDGDAPSAGDHRDGGKGRGRGGAEDQGPAPVFRRLLQGSDPSRPLEGLLTQGRAIVAAVAMGSFLIVLSPVLGKERPVSIRRPD